MKNSFEEALALVLRHEGGFVNHPDDPGGATNKGVTQATYDAWRKRQKLPPRSVRSITAAEVNAIYRRDYWDKVKADDLPAGVDYAVFDFAVNSGPSRAIKFLQRVLGVTDDGKIGPITMAALSDFPPGYVIAELCDARLAWLKRLKTWPTFGKGWTRRVVDVERAALEMADTLPARPLDPEPVPPPPDIEPTPPPDDTDADWFAAWWGALVLAAALLAVAAFLYFT